MGASRSQNAKRPLLLGALVVAELVRSTTVLTQGAGNEKGIGADDALSV